MFRKYLALILNTEGIVDKIPILDLYQEADRKHPSCYIIYQLPGREPVRHMVPHAFYQGLMVGSEVYLRYHPEKPELIRLEV